MSTLALTFYCIIKMLMSIKKNLTISKSYIIVNYYLMFCNHFGPPLSVPPEVSPNESALKYI